MADAIQQAETIDELGDALTHEWYEASDGSYPGVPHWGSRTDVVEAAIDASCPEADIVSWDTRDADVTAHRYVVRRSDRGRHEFRVLSHADFLALGWVTTTVTARLIESARAAGSEARAQGVEPPFDEDAVAAHMLTDEEWRELRALPEWLDVRDDCLAAFEAGWSYPASRLVGLRSGDPSAAPLAEGEVTRIVRVRGPADAVHAFAALTASERGAVVAAWHERG